VLARFFAFNGKQFMQGVPERAHTQRLHTAFRLLQEQQGIVKTYPASIGGVENIQNCSKITLADTKKHEVPRSASASYYI